MNPTFETKEVPFIPVLTFVLWMLVCIVATIGLVVPYVRPRASEKKEVSITAETLQVELSSDRVAFAEPPKTPNPPPLSQPVPNLQTLPTLTPVAEPSVVAFALPVEGPVQIVAAKAAAYVAPAELAKSDAPASATAPAPQQLVYGEGEGKQPAPEYPYRARQEGQEGVVKVRFTVGENGRVLSAEAASSSLWPMLNQSAVRVVRERWRFRPGAIRVYEVSIKFQLKPQ
jgi:periplasmic protein TonB